MVKHSRDDNPYAIGHSPTKRCKFEHSSPAHILSIVPIKGHMYEIIVSQHPTHTNSDAFMPFIFHLIKGDVIKDKEGNVIDNELYQACRKLLTEMGFKSWGFLRGPDGARIVSSDCGRYHRQVVVKTNSPDQIREGRTAEEMLMDLRQFVDITQKIGDVVNTYTTVYEAANKVQYERPADEKLPPLDYYLTDEGVLEELKRNIDNDFLNPEFVKNYYDVACAYFNPYRTDLPESVRSYGFPIGSALSEMGDCKRKSRVDLEDLKQFPFNE